MAESGDAATQGHKNSPTIHKKKDHSRLKHFEHIHTKKLDRKNLHTLPKLSKKTKRSTYSRNWKSSSYGDSNSMPPYLVYNRKIGAYYPYFKYPSENNVRRKMRKDSRYNK